MFQFKNPNFYQLNKNLSYSSKNDRYLLFITYYVHLLIKNTFTVIRLQLVDLHHYLLHYTLQNQIYF